MLELLLACDEWKVRDYSAVEKNKTYWAIYTFYHIFVISLALYRLIHAEPSIGIRLAHYVKILTATCVRNVTKAIF